MGQFEKKSPRRSTGRYEAPANAPRRRSKKSRWQLPLWIFLVADVIYDEILLHFWTMSGFHFGRFLCVLLFATCSGFLVSFLSHLGKSAKLHRIIGTTLLSIIGVFILFEYFLYDAYKVFMVPTAVLDTVGDVAAEYSGTVFSLIGRNIWRVFMIAIPIVVYALIAHKYRWGKLPGLVPKLLLLAFFIISFGLSTLSAYTISPDTKKYGKEYTFDTSVHSFGMLTSFRLQLQHGGKASNGFEIDTPKTEKTKPTKKNGKDTTTEPSESVPDATEPEVTEKVYVPHEVDIDFAALADSAKDSDIKSVNNYIASLTPSKTNDYTGLFEGKNLIFITAEAFSAEVIDPQITPTLYRMATKGIEFTDYYQPAWGGSTSTGEYSLMTGLVPTNGVKSIQITADHNMYYTIGNQLRRQGYFSAAYHNNTYTYYSRNVTHCNLGYDTFMGMGNGMEKGVTKRWPESDQEMMNFTVDMFIDKQPFSIYYMTVSGHCLYSRTGNNMSKKNYDAIDAMNLDCSETVKCYYAANLDLEYAMRDLLAKLEEEGIADDTVIVIGADHYPYGLEKSDTWYNYEDYLAELYGYEVTDCFQRDHSDLIIWSGCIEDLGLRVDTPTYSLDVVPTLCNLFGVEYDSRLLPGRDVFSDETPIALWGNYSWKTDKGTYNASNSKFTPAEGVTVDDDYVSSISKMVKNKIYFSKIALNKDYYGYLFK